MSKIKAGALSSYGINIIVERYMQCIEEIFNIPKLLKVFEYVVKYNKLDYVLNEIIHQCKVEFNFSDNSLFEDIKNT